MQKFKNFLKLIFLVNVIPVSVDFGIYYILTRTVVSFRELFPGSSVPNPIFDATKWLVMSDDGSSYGRYSGISLQLSNILLHPWIVVGGNISLILLTILLLRRYAGEITYSREKGKKSQQATLTIVKIIFLVYNFLIFKSVLCSILSDFAPGYTDFLRGLGVILIPMQYFFGVILLWEFIIGFIGPLVMLTTSIVYFSIKKKHTYKNIKQS